MKKSIKKLGKGLSIKELEKRMELSVAVTADLEVSKRCDGGTETIYDPTGPDLNPGL